MSYEYQKHEFCIFCRVLFVFRWVAVTWIRRWWNRKAKPPNASPCGFEPCPPLTTCLWESETARTQIFHHFLYGKNMFLYVQMLKTYVKNRKVSQVFYTSLLVETSCKKVPSKYDFISSKSWRPPSCAGCMVHSKTSFARESVVMLRSQVSEVDQTCFPLECIFHWFKHHRVTLHGKSHGIAMVELLYLYFGILYLIVLNWVCMI